MVSMTIYLFRYYGNKIPLRKTMYLKNILAFTTTMSDRFEHPTETYVK
jgi:hypothetical protein